MTDRDIIERFARLFELRGPYRRLRQNPTHKTQWSCETSRSEIVRDVLESFMPYFGMRRRAKAEEALKVLSENAAALERTCYCGRTFQAGKTTQIYCSEECCDEIHKIRMRERYWRLKEA